MSTAKLIKSNNIQYDSFALRNQAEQKGYLFFSDLIDPNMIMEVRRGITSILQEVGWIDIDTDPLLAITSHVARLTGSPEFSQVYDMIQCLESFHSLAHHMSLLQITESLLQSDVLL